MEIRHENFAPGTLLAERFKIVRHIATGSMGTVFLAIDRKLGDVEVALKVLHSKFLADKVAFKRFSNEVVFARKLTHPNIVRIFDFGESNSGQKMISMEYVEGSTLDQLFTELHGDVSNLDKGSAIYEVEFQRLLTIYKKLLVGVDFAHKAGILHRDLKPCNVMLDKKDEPKIGDFGLATIAGVSSGLTSDGQSLIGTPDYMAPEQVLGQRMTARSDIYSLGIIAYQLVAGRVPFSADGALAVAYMQVQAPMPSLEKFPKFVPHNFIKLIERATRKNPHERFSSVEEMISLLEQNTLPAVTPKPKKELVQVKFPTRKSSRYVQPRRSHLRASFNISPPSNAGFWLLTIGFFVAMGTGLYYAAMAYLEAQKPKVNYVIEYDSPLAESTVKSEKPK